MDLHGLPIDLAQFVQQEIAEGQYPSPEAGVSAALRLLQAHEGEGQNGHPSDDRRSVTQPTKTDADTFTPRTPLPQTQLAEGELEAALEPLWRAEQAQTLIWKEDERGKPTLIAQGYEYPRQMSVEVEGKPCEWSERRLVVRYQVPLKSTQKRVYANCMSQNQESDFMECLPCSDYHSIFSIN